MVTAAVPFPLEYVHCVLALCRLCWLDLLVVDVCSMCFCSGKFTWWLQLSRLPSSLALIPFVVQHTLQ
jgi:hypothetical protein